MCFGFCVLPLVVQAELWPVLFVYRMDGRDERGIPVTCNGEFVYRFMRKSLNNVSRRIMKWCEFVLCCIPFDFQCELNLTHAAINGRFELISSFAFVSRTLFPWPLDLFEIARWLNRHKVHRTFIAFYKHKTLIEFSERKKGEQR